MRQLGCLFVALGIVGCAVETSDPQTGNTTEKPAVVFETTDSAAASSAVVLAKYTCPGMV